MGRWAQVWGVVARRERKRSDEVPLDRLNDILRPVALPRVEASGEQRAVRPEASGLRDRLEMRRHLARGGMGDIHVAHDPVLGRDVAVKVMLESRQSGMDQRFAIEARVTAQLDHPNIVPVHDADLSGHEGLAYSMKLVSGATLTEVLNAANQARAHGEVLPSALSLDAFLDYFVKICDAVAYAHEKGVVHRDLKPDNVMIGAHGEVYVMDWGLARVLGDADVLAPSGGLRTQPGYAVGTALYMAPEQAMGQEMGPPCDQFALGLILYEMVCGRSPRLNDGDVERGLERASRGERRPIAAVGGQRVRRELAGIVSKATQPRIQDRYGSVRDLVEDLRRFRANLPVRASPDSVPQRVQRWLSANREVTLRLVLLMALLLVTVSAGVLALIAGGAGLYASWAQAREERVTRLVTQVGSQAAELEASLALIRGHVESVAAASQVLLEHADPGEELEVLAPTVFESAAKPADTAWSKSYARPISTWWPDVVISPGVDRAVAVEDARRLVPIRHVMRRAHINTRRAIDGFDPTEADTAWREDPGPIRWAIVGTPSGVYLEMPGAAWDASGFDGRLRPWYTLATEPRPRWSEPYAESSTGSLLVACSMQIPGEDGDVLGVASLSVSFTYLAERFLTIDHPAVDETFLVDRTGRILMASGQVDPQKRPDDLRETYATSPFPDPVLAPALSEQAGAVSATNGDLLLHYPLNNGWWFVARVDADEAASAW